MAKSTSKLFEEEKIRPMTEGDINPPEEEEEVRGDSTDVVEPSTGDDAVEDDIVDIDLSATKKKKFRINGDKNKIIELNTSDMNISSRLSVAYSALNKSMEEVGKILSDVPDESSEITDEMRDKVNEQLDIIDGKMKSWIDFIFDAPVSEICSDGGSMYDPFDGMFRFEHIIEALAALYEDNLSKEFEKMRTRVNRKTSKYVKHYHN